MKKIPTLFQRDPDNRSRVVPTVTPGCEWVLAGEGYATQKFDGTACLVRDGLLYKRFDAKAGKTPPSGFVAAQEAPDPETGHWPGWVLVGEGPEDRWHREALAEYESGGRVIKDWTYELCGPKIQGNTELLDRHVLVRHGSGIWMPSYETVQPEAAFTMFCQLLDIHKIEGIVWWRDIKNQDCDKVKLKRRDFGLKWPV